MEAVANCHACGARFLESGAAQHVCDPEKVPTAGFEIKSGAIVATALPAKK